MNQSRIIKGLFLGLGVLALQSCDKDFINVGGDVIGDENLNINTYKVENIVSYNQEIGAMDTKNLIETPLGSINSDAFGNSTSSIVTQLTFDSSAFSVIGENAKIDSVYVYIPYYSTYSKTEDNEQIYDLGGVYGEGSFNLEVFQNGYYLNNSDISTGNTIKYFSDNSYLFDNSIVNSNSKLNNSNEPNQNTRFYFTNKNIIIPERDSEGNVKIDENTGKPKAKETFAPGMWLDLDKEYFQREWLDKKDLFTDAGAFNNLFRGLYFKATNNNSKGAIGLLNLASGKFVINYTYDSKSTDKEGEETITQKKGSMSLSFANLSSSSISSNKNVTINLFNNTKTDLYKNALANTNKTAGDEKLFVKGTDGSVALISLFNDSAELVKLREMNIMVNDAILTVFVDKNAMSGDNNPPRLQLYNYDNESYISDFVLDNTTSGTIMKPYYGGIFEKEDTENSKDGFVYRLRITNHIANLISDEKAKNPKLAITVANEYNSGLLSAMTFKDFKQPITNSPSDIKLANPFTIGCPIGTVLYGTNTSELSKKMKLEIFYTKK